MYLRTTPRRNNDGSVVRYLQLAHNTWDPAAKRSRVRVLYNFGREDHHNRAALHRLVASVSRFLDPDQTLAATAGQGLAFVESRPLGGVWALDELWRRLGIDQTMRRLLTGRRLDASAERVLFALVANRALAPSSKLAAGSATTWPSQGWSAPATMPATGRWTGCWRSTTSWSERSSARSPRCWTSRSTCCSSTPPPPTSSSTSRTRPSLGTQAGCPCPDPATAPVTAAMGVRTRRGSAATATPKTTATTCRRWWSGWRSPVGGSRSGCGAGRAAPPTP